MKTSMHLLGLTLLLLGARPARGQSDPAAYRQKAESAAKRVTELQEAAKEKLGAARKSVGDDENKVQNDLDEIAGKVNGQDFAAAVGIIPNAEGRLEDVPEASRPAFKTALAALARTLEEGVRARARMEALQPLGDRLENLQAQAKENADLHLLLREMDDLVAQVHGAQALTPQEIAGLRVHLAGHRTASHKRRAGDLREKIKTELTQLEAEFPAIQKGLADRAERESAVSRFDQVATTIQGDLAPLPADDPAVRDLRGRLAKLETPVRETYTKMQGAAVSERLKANLDFQAYMFENWKQEQGAVSAEEYLKIDCTIQHLAHPKTVALVNLANPWFAFVQNDPEYQRINPDQKFKAHLEAVQKERDAAVTRMLGICEALVAEIEKAGIAGQEPRDRAVFLADWDLRTCLQEHPKMWDLIARVQKLTDAFDRKALAGDAAVAKIREEALKTVEAHWTRMYGAVPIAGGFTGDQAGKFRDRFVRAQMGRNIAGEFVPGEFDLVFRLDGELLAGRYEPAVKAAVAAGRARFELKPSDADDYEIVAQVGAEGTLTVPSPDGKAPGAELPCRRLRVTGVRFGPVAHLVR
jgi:hypothetical protein